MALIRNMLLEGPLANKGLRSFQNRPIRPHRPPDLWFVIADAGHARIFQREGQDVICIGEAAPYIPYEKEQGNRFIGRRMRQKAQKSDIKGANRQAMEPTNDSQIHEEMLFIESLAGYLDKALEHDAYEDLIIIAAPRTLGHLRRVLPDRVKDAIREEVNRDLVNMPEQALKGALLERLQPP